MEENYYEDYEIDLKALLQKLLSGWKRIMIWMAAAAVVGLVIAFSLPKKYRTTSVLAPELRMNKSSLGSLSSLTSLAGLSSSMLTSTEAMYPDLYPTIVSSTPFLSGLLEMPVTVSTKDGPVNTTLQEFYAKYQKHPWWAPILGFPGKAAGWVSGLLKKEEESPSAATAQSASADGSVPFAAPVYVSEELDGAMKALNSCIEMEVDKKTALITIVVVTQDKAVTAKLMAEILCRLKEYVTDYRTEKARHDLEYIQGVNDEARQNYTAAQQRFARYADANQNMILFRAKAEQDRLQNDMTLAYQLYMQTSQQVQLARAKVQESTPVFAVIEPATIPLKPCKPSKTMILFVFLVLGACIGSAITLLKSEE